MGVACAPVEVDRQDGRQLGARGPQQCKPLGLRAGEGVLVGANIGAEWLQQDPRQDALHARIVRCVGARVTVVIGR